MKTSFLSTGNSIFLFQVFFCQWKILLKFGESQILKTNHIPAGGHQFCSIFSDIFTVETVLKYGKSVFFNILYPAIANEFSAYENNIFLVGAILQLLEIISVDSGSFFLLVETSISTKSFILASGNGISS